MSDHRLGSLRDYLVQHYDDLKRRLTSRLGNPELASDALHDAYVRLQDKSGTEHGETLIAHPGAYLFRMAFHLAVDHERSAERRLSTTEVDELLQLTDHAPGPAHIAESEQELAQLLRELDALPRRRRELLLAMRLDGTPREELAARYRISLRTVDRELEKAYAFCQARLEARQR